MKFNSQICTSREQSERLLALGLKKETADMTHHYLHSIDGYELKDVEFSRIMHLQELVNKKPIMGRTGDDLYAKDIPAWSLHRLIEMMPQSIYHKNLACFLFIDQSVYVEYRLSLYGASQTRVEQFMKSNLWENLIDCISWLIKEGYFNKEYLVDEYLKKMEV